MNLLIVVFLKIYAIPHWSEVFLKNFYIPPGAWYFLDRGGVFSAHSLRGLHRGRERGHDGPAMSSANFSLGRPGGLV
jgi:hypothetical protein